MIASTGTAFLPDDRQASPVSLGSLDQAGLTGFAARLGLMAKEFLG